MKTKTIALVCALIAPVVIAQTTTTVTRETVTTTAEVMRLDSTHPFTVRNFAPGDKITVETSPDTQPVTVKLDPGVVYTDAKRQPISPRLIQPGSRIRLDLAGSNAGRVVVGVTLLQAQ